MKEGEGMMEELQDITLTITLHPGGKPPSVSGPLMNKPICLYMLEIAKDFVKVYAPEDKVKPAGIIDFARKRFK